MSPLNASYALWVIWGISWMLAAVWTARTDARPSNKEQIGHWGVTVLGFALLFTSVGAHMRNELGAISRRVTFWALPDLAGWALCALVLTGFAICWWARLHLGRMWSLNVARKQDHYIVCDGPYAIVRHPIYTGLILAAFALALQTGSIVAVGGAALMTFGFTRKAVLEERFLREELGPEAYDAYRRDVPMLIPFVKP